MILINLKLIFFASRSNASRFQPSLWQFTGHSTRWRFAYLGFAKGFMSDSVHNGAFGTVSSSSLNWIVRSKKWMSFRCDSIHGINWSHKQETHLTTASQDGTVKYFDINNPRRAEKIITTSSPVWRARYTVSVYSSRASESCSSLRSFIPAICWRLGHCNCAKLGSRRK